MSRTAALEIACQSLVPEDACQTRRRVSRFDEVLRAHRCARRHRAGWARGSDPAGHDALPGRSPGAYRCHFVACAPLGGSPDLIDHRGPGARFMREHPAWPRGTEEPVVRPHVQAQRASSEASQAPRDSMPGVTQRVARRSSGYDPRRFLPASSIDIELAGSHYALSSPAVVALQRSIGNQAVVQMLSAMGDPLVVSRVNGNTRKRSYSTAFGSLPSRPVRQRTQTGALDRERFWNGPIYGPFDPFWGGTSVTVELGPAATLPTSYGSRPYERACTAVNRLNPDRRRRMRAGWIKGHLLNDSLGGPGSSRNLTPLTHRADMHFKTRVETPVKDALAILYGRCSRHEMRDVSGRELLVGVRFSVRIVGQDRPRSRRPHRQRAGDHLLATCAFISKPVTNGPVTVMQQPPQGLQPLPTGVQVRCVQ